MPAKISTVRSSLCTPTTSPSWVWTGRDGARSSPPARRVWGDGWTSTAVVHTRAPASSHPPTCSRAGLRAPQRAITPATIELERESCRERVWQYVLILVVGGYLKQTNKLQ